MGLTEDHMPNGIGRNGRNLDIAAVAVASTPAMKLKTAISRIFTWWNGETYGTQVWTALYGEFVGADEFGNRYYRTKGGKIDPTLGFERRWVTYNGYAEPTTVGPAWHGWLHHTVDTPPTEDKVDAATVVEAAPAQSDRHTRRTARPVRRSPRYGGPRRPATTRPGRPDE